MSSPQTSKADKKAVHSSSYIPHKYIQNLLTYKYTGSDRSILSTKILCHYWNFVISLIPMNIAPNVLTLTGFIVGMSSSFVLLYYMLFQEAVFPAWVWYYAAFGLFFYQTFDAIDGKQARRTKSGSPLGELFDHGCDAFLTPFVQLNATLACGMPPWMRFCFMMVSSVGLFTAIWEQYSTGLLDLGYISAPTEGICLLCVLFVVTGVCGTALWDSALTPPIEVALPLPLALTNDVLGTGPITVHFGSLRSYLFVFFIVSSVITEAVNVLHIFVVPSVHGSRVVGVVAGLPAVVLTALHVVLYVCHRNVPRAFPFCMELSLAVVMMHTVTRLIISRLCKMPFRFFNPFTIVAYLATIAFIALHFVGDDVVSPAVVSNIVGWGSLVVTVLGVCSYGHMVTCVFRQIAGFLGIRIFLITHPDSKKSA